MFLVFDYSGLTIARCSGRQHYNEVKQVSFFQAELLASPIWPVDQARQMTLHPQKWSNYVFRKMVKLCVSKKFYPLFVSCFNWFSLRH